MVKVLMGWNILPGQESEYFDFIIQEFESGLSDIGLQTTEVWYTVYGDWPQIITGAVAQDLDAAREALSSMEWRKLKGRLLQYVTDYQRKVIPATGGYQL
ncbi:MAG: hypothetical protein PVI59_09990 [Anaerolineae bacterium]